MNAASFDALMDTGSYVCTVRASSAMAFRTGFEKDNLKVNVFRKNRPWKGWQGSVKLLKSAASENRVSS